MAIVPVAPAGSAAQFTPITPVNSLAQLRTEGFSSQNTEQNDVQMSFMDILNRMVSSVNQTSTQTAYDAVNLAAGNIYDDNLHNIEIEATKAEISLQALISIRNKAMDAYSEIMRMNF